MKTNKIIAAWLAVTAITTLSFGSTFAMWWQGNGWGQLSQYVTADEKAELQSLPQEDRKSYIEELKAKYNVTNSWENRWKKWEKWQNGKWDHNMWDMISDIEKQDVDSIEIDLLEKQYEEEKMANELYMSFYDMYNLDTFKNIAESEAKHMEAVKTLLDRYEIDIPTDYSHIQWLYDDLKEKWALSLLDALEVWVSIEKVDIDDIITAIKASDNDDIKTVLVNIWWASYNHMRWFVKALDNNWLTTDIDYSNYYDEDNSKWNIKVRLAERLENEGVNLPEWARSKAINEKCDNKWDEHGEGKNHHDEGRKWWNHDNDWKMNKGSNKWNINSALKNKYKNAYEVKYGSAIAKMNDSYLEAFIWKIDDILVKVKNWNYSDSIKEKYNAMLYALKDIAVNNLDEENIFDWLFN